MSKFDENEGNVKGIVHAAVITTQKIINSVGAGLSNHFIKFEVNLLNVMPAESYGPDAVTLILSGREINIKKSLELLKQLSYKKSLGIETEPVKSLPPVIKGYLNDMENVAKFERLYSFCSKEYLDDCVKRGIQPHPEVLESI